MMSISIRNKTGLLFTIAVTSLHVIAVAQVKYKNEINNAKKVVINQYINGKPALGSVLLLNKYLDTSKEICVSSQGYSVCNPMLIFRLPGGNITPVLISETNIPIKLTADKKGHLILNCRIYNLEGQVISLVENNIINPAGLGVLKQTSTDTSLRVLNEYGIPILIINIHRKTNTIEFKCVTFNEMGNILYIISDKGIEMEGLGKPQLLKSQEERDRIWFFCRQKIMESGMN